MDNDREYFSSIPHVPRRHPGDQMLVVRMNPPSLPVPVNHNVTMQTRPPFPPNGKGNLFNLACKTCYTTRICLGNGELRHDTRREQNGDSVTVKGEFTCSRHQQCKTNAFTTHFIYCGVVNNFFNYTTFKFQYFEIPNNYLSFI